MQWIRIGPSECGEPQRLFSDALESRPELPFFAVRPRAALRDSPRTGARQMRILGERLPAQQSERQTELIENSMAKQKLAMKVQSTLRVICATPLPKTALGQRSERFLCCVCRDLR
jgi:hypothetical protein